MGGHRRLSKFSFQKTAIYSSLYTNTPSWVCVGGVLGQAPFPKQLPHVLLLGKSSPPTITPHIIPSRYGTQSKSMTSCVQHLHELQWNSYLIEVTMKLLYIRGTQHYQVIARRKTCTSEHKTWVPRSIPGNSSQKCSIQLPTWNLVSSHYMYEGNCSHESLIAKSVWKRSAPLSPKLKGPSYQQNTWHNNIPLASTPQRVSSWDCRM